MEDPDFSATFITQLSSAAVSPGQVCVLGCPAWGASPVAWRHSFAAQACCGLRAPAFPEEASYRSWL